MNRFHNSILLLSTIACLLPLYGQESSSDDDVFDSGAFDQAVAEGAAVDSQNRLQYLPGVSFVSEANGYHTIKSEASGSDARFYGKAFLKATKADIGSLYLGYNYSWLMFASASDAQYSTFYQAQKPDPRNIRASLSEFHVSFDIKKHLFIRIGDQLLSWGASWFWTPIDFVNRQKAQASVISVVDTRSGKPGVRLHLPYKAMNIFLFTDFSNVISNRKAGSLKHDVAQAWRIDATVQGIQFGTVGYIARNRPEQIGFDATGNVFGIDLYGELGCTFTDAFNKAPDYAFSLGGSRLFGKDKNWTGRTEFYFNSNGYLDLDQSKMLPGEFTPFYSGKYYLYGEISGVNLANSMLAVSFFGFSNLADHSYSTTMQCTIDLPGVLPFTVFGRYYGGKKYREFTNAFGGDAISVGLRIRADF
jgi:hypothetical protein